MTVTSPETVFRRELIDLVHWDDLIRLIVGYPCRVLAADSVHLFVRNPREPGFSCVGHWSRDSVSLSEQIPDRLIVPCRRCLEASSAQDMVLDSCSIDNGLEQESCVVRYCAPLVYREEAIAVLLIHFPTGLEPTCQQIQAVTCVLPEMSLALASFRLHRSLRILVDEAESSRRRFAQDLHDSLAHTIGYLRLKLDQFSIEGAQLEHEESRAQIECMRNAADEAYELIRHRLAELEPICTTGLTETISEQANVIGQRGGFEVRISSTCEPSQVAPEIQRQALYICREALNNTGRHAQAKCADIHINWGKDCFTLSITDDGIGFNTGDATLDNHFGLAIMKQRAQSVGGELTIRSSPGNGTRIFVWLPAAFTHDGPY